LSGEDAQGALVRRDNGLFLQEGAADLAAVPHGGRMLRLIDEPGLLLLAAAGSAAPGWLGASLSLAPSVQLVAFIIGARLTGVFEVRLRGGCRQLYFEDGQYAGARTDFLDDSFGQFLWRAGRISLDKVVIALEEARSSGKRLGRVLVDLGYLTKAELRPALRRQGEALFEAACVVDEGYGIFRPGAVHPNPIRFFDYTTVLLQRAGDAAAECVELRRRIGSLDALCEKPSGVVGGRLGEAENALMQLLGSAKGAPMSARQLLAKSGLGELHGLSALANLFTAGRLTRLSDDARAPAQSTGLERLCEVINYVLAALDKKGFGLLDEVRQFAAEPPAGEPPTLRLLAISAPLTADDVLRRGAEASPAVGAEGMERALQALLEFALFHARDTLEPAAAEALDAEAAALAREPAAE
jgi:hypothetical protein